MNQCKPLVLGAAHLTGIQLRLMGGDAEEDIGWAWEVEPPKLPEAEAA